MTCTMVASGGDMAVPKRLISAAMTLPWVSFAPAVLERHGADARVHRDQESSAVDLLVGAEQPLLAAFDDLDDMSFAAAALFAVDAHHHLIAMHDPAHLAAVQVNVFGVFVFRE